MLASISPDYCKQDVEFIKKHSFVSEEDDEQFFKCFFHDITQESDEFFSLRMLFYERYPQMLNRHIDFISAIKRNPLRMVRVFGLFLKNNVKPYEVRIFTCVEQYLFKDSDISIEEGIEIVDLLLPYVPKNNVYNDWSVYYRHKQTLERACIQIIKKANAVIISSDPDIFWEKYSPFMSRGYQLFNEIILDGFLHMPLQYSDRILNYLAEDIGKNIISETGNVNDKLLLGKKVLNKHSDYCGMLTFQQLETRIVHYVSPRAKEDYLRRIEFNKVKGNSKNYWSFWGDLQFELLHELPERRLSIHAKELLQVLGRKFSNGITKYSNHESRFGSAKSSNARFGLVKSPIAGKELSVKNWVEILTSKKLKYKTDSKWTEVPDGIVINSVEQFSDSFREVVSKQPIEMIKLVILNKDSILEEFTDACYRGIAYSDCISEIPENLLKEAILSFPYDYESQRASYLIDIIRKRSELARSKEILNILIDIAVNHKNPELGRPVVTNIEDSEMKSVDMLEINAINCVRGSALLAMGELLQEDSSFFEQFKDVIEILTLDENNAVKYATLFCFLLTI